MIGARKRCSSVIYWSYALCIVCDHTLRRHTRTGATVDICCMTSVQCSMRTLAIICHISARHHVTYCELSRCALLVYATVTCRRCCAEEQLPRASSMIQKMCSAACCCCYWWWWCSAEHAATTRNQHAAAAGATAVR
jgi:hypothetical protein